MALVLMDVDGVLRTSRRDDGLVTCKEDQRILPDAEPAIRLLTDCGHTVALVTNQGWARETDWRPVVAALGALRRAVGLLPNYLYVCWHARDAGCTCRKPKPGLLQEAIASFPDALGTRRAVWMVGDAWSDMVAGTAVGARTVYVGDYPYKQLGKTKIPPAEELPQPDFIIRGGVLMAARLITGIERITVATLLKKG